MCEGKFSHAHQSWVQSSLLQLRKKKSNSLLSSCGEGGCGGGCGDRGWIHLAISSGVAIDARAAASSSSTRCSTRVLAWLFVGASGAPTSNGALFVALVQFVRVGRARSTPRSVYVAVARIAIGCPQLKLVPDRLSTGVDVVDNGSITAVAAPCSCVPGIH